MQLVSKEPAKKKAKVLRCPTCRTLVTARDADFPFCSDHCRQVDLGKWASGAYRITSPILDPDVLDSIESGRQFHEPDEE